MKQGYAAPVHVNYDNDRRRSLGYRPLWNVQSAQALPPRRRRCCRRRRWQKEREQTLRPQDMARPLLARPPPGRRETERALSRELEEPRGNLRLLGGRHCL